MALKINDIIAHSNELRRRPSYVDGTSPDDDQNEQTNNPDAEDINLEDMNIFTSRQFELMSQLRRNKLDRQSLKAQLQKTIKDLARLEHQLDFHRQRLLKDYEEWFKRSDNKPFQTKPRILVRPLLFIKLTINLLSHHEKVLWSNDSKSSSAALPILIIYYISMPTRPILILQKELFRLQNELRKSVLLELKCDMFTPSGLICECFGRGYLSLASDIAGVR